MSACFHRTLQANGSGKIQIYLRSTSDLPPIQANGSGKIQIYLRSTSDSSKRLWQNPDLPPIYLRFKQTALAKSRSTSNGKESNQYAVQNCLPIDRDS
ncbi:unnamed protein product [Schistocephalus solidus]|uniref:Fe2OG dioxygenase domain-containing protein n=1 Tax=Schistocephalus solidus TaxID=70667 RepID=A0A183TGQ4_SCHSO|nr:unnamed protein product [Schistocephalus solidus]